MKTRLLILLFALFGLLGSSTVLAHYSGHTVYTGGLTLGYDGVYVSVPYLAHYRGPDYGYRRSYGYVGGYKYGYRHGRSYRHDKHYRHGRSYGYHKHYRHGRHGSHRGSHDRHRRDRGHYRGDHGHYRGGHGRHHGRHGGGRH